MDVRQALIVDDSKLVCFKLGKMLEERGISSHAVGSGEEALVYLGANPPPDVVFIDIMMPGMDGYQTTAAIRAQGAFARLPIIMCSSNDTEADRAKARVQGANAFLPKPPAMEHLIQVLADLPPALTAAPTPTKEAHAPTQITEDQIHRWIHEALAAAEQDLAARMENRIQALANHWTQDATETSNTRMDDQTQQLILASEETARRVATESARQVAERVVSELSHEHIREAAAQTTSEVARNLVLKWVPELVAERVTAIADQTVQATITRMAETLLQPVASSVVKSMVPGILAEAKTHRDAQLAHEIPSAVAQAVAAFLESESFRQSVHRTMSVVASSMVEPLARTTAENAARVAIDHALAQALDKSSSTEQTTQAALQHLNASVEKLRYGTLAVGAGVLLIALYLAVKLFIH